MKDYISVVMMKQVNENRWCSLFSPLTGLSKEPRNNEGEDI